jgi:N utilization substance protein B
MSSPAAAEDKTKPPRKPKSSRHRAREFAIQGLYQWQLSGNEVAGPSRRINAQAECRRLREARPCPAIEAAAARRVIDEAADTAGAMSSRRNSTRPYAEISPVERNAILLMAAFELKDTARQRPTRW